jgi:hypothetical protein
MYGAHSESWAPEHMPATPCDDEVALWRNRCEMRARADASRLAGECHFRTWPFRAEATTAGFFVTCMSIDGPWLALGQADGKTSLFNLTSDAADQRRWCEGSFGEFGRYSVPDEFAAVIDVHVCALCGMVTTLHSLGAILVRSLRTGAVLYFVDGLAPELLVHVDEHIWAFANNTETLIRVASLRRVCLYSPERAGPEAAELGLRLVAFGDADEELGGRSGGGCRRRWR